MTVFDGRGVYGAVAVGKAQLFKRHQTKVRRVSVSKPEQELERLRAAKDAAVRQLSAIHKKARKELGEAGALIFEIHMMMLDDDDFIDTIKDMIRTQRVNAEYAVSSAADSFAKMFSDMEDAYMQARSADVRDISNRLIACLSKGGGSRALPDGKMIICADDLAPSETILLDRSKVTAIVTAFGSANSHTAILAAGMNTPAVIGVGKEFLDAVEDGCLVGVDGHTGEVFVDPDDKTIRHLKQKQSEDSRRYQLLEQLKGKESITLDEKRVSICANIGGECGTDAAIANDADGIGLFRSEFLYLGSEDYPTEEQQFRVYKNVLESMKGKKVVIRTLDIGADKQAGYFGLEKEENPALGFRAIRICLSRPEIFLTQLRALYRASAFGELAIMFPMITSVPEVRQCLDMCEQVRKELKENGIRFDENTELGIMIETPAAAVISDRLAPMVDFFSVGTNDLTQYTLACDRQNERLRPFVDTHHEAILRLIEMSAKNAHENNAWIGICGELAADLTLTEKFLRMGIDEFSVSPPFVLPLREKVRSISLK